MPYENSGGRGRSANSRLNSFPSNRDDLRMTMGHFYRVESTFTGYRQFGLGNQIGRRLFVGDDFAL